MRRRWVQGGHGVPDPGISFSRWVQFGHRVPDPWKRERERERGEGGKGGAKVEGWVAITWNAGATAAMGCK
eukprot:5437625-Pyramimonas_sp.AAC.1